MIPLSFIMGVLVGAGAALAGWLLGYDTCKRHAQRWRIVLDRIGQELRKSGRVWTCPMCGGAFWPGADSSEQTMETLNGRRNDEPNTE